MSNSSCSRPHHLLLQTLGNFLVLDEELDGVPALRWRWTIGFNSIVPSARIMLDILALGDFERTMKVGLKIQTLRSSPHHLQES